MTDIQEMIHEVFSDALEGFALLFLERPDDGGVLDAETPYFFSSIIIQHNTERIRLMIGAPEPICFEMAANVTGSDTDEMPKHMAVDALNELSNITAGSWAARYFGEKEVCALEAPQAIEVSSAEMQRLRDQEKMTQFLVEEYPVLIGISFDPEEA